MCLTRLNLLTLQLGTRAPHHAGPPLEGPFLSFLFSLHFPKKAIQIPVELCRLRDRRSKGERNGL